MIARAAARILARIVLALSFTFTAAYPVIAQQQFSDWGWPVPREQISKKSIEWLKNKGWWPLMIAWQPPWPGQNTLEIVMKNKGLLEARGLKAEWQAFQSGPAINEVIVAARSQIAGGGNFPITTLLDKKIPIKIIAIGSPNLLHGLIVPNDSAVKTIKDLKNSSPAATIGLVTGSSAEFYFQMAAKVNGLVVGKDVILKNMPPAEQMLMPKGISAVVSWDPTASMIVSERENGRMVDEIYPYNIYGAFFYVRSELVENVPDVVQAYTDALMEASLWIRRFPEEATSLTAESPELKYFSKAILAKSVEKYNNIYKPTYMYPHADFWGAANESIFNWLYESKRITRPLTRRDLAEAIAPTFMDKTFAKLGWTVPKRPVFLKSDWNGDLSKPPYPEYLTPQNLRQPQEFPASGDLVKAWTFAGKTYSP